MIINNASLITISLIITFPLKIMSDAYLPADEATRCPSTLVFSLEDGPQARMCRCRQAEGGWR